MDSFIAILLLVSQAGILAPTVDNLIVSLPDGQIRGIIYEYEGTAYYGFQGIPYAKPPTGVLRFEAPQPPERWTGVRDAFSDAPSCITNNYLQAQSGQSEDCLYVNVYTPSLQPQEKLPVLFHIHGGGFVQGDSSKKENNPDYFIPENVIVVTFNYRFGPFGFISTGDLAIPGNAGMKDQTLALKWTYENIRYFGGDPEKITIFGESTGAVSIGLHLISKKSTGLFRAAIAQSGGALNHWSADPDSLLETKNLVSKLSGDIDLNDTQNIKEFLKSKSVEEIMGAMGSLPDLQFLPVVEPEHEDAFISESHYELMKSGNFNRVPIILGICSEESLLYLQNLANAKEVANSFDLVPENIIPEDLNPNESDVNTVVQKVRGIYLENGVAFGQNLSALAKYLTDNQFTRAIFKQAEMHSIFAPVYVYQFAYYGGRSVVSAFIDGAGQAGHTAELPYLWKSSLASQDPLDVLTQKRMIKLWTNFAKYLIPTPEESNLFDNVMWPKFELDSRYYLNINNSLEARMKLKQDTLNSWDEVYDKYGKKPFITY